LDARARFFPNAERLVVAYANSRTYLWDLRPQALERRACQVAGRTLSKPEQQQFVGSAYRPVCR
jgi:hypothetical protein